MEVQKLEPLKCPQCGSTCCVTKNKDVICGACVTITDKDGKTSKVTGYKGGGTDPKVEMGDYIEGSEGVHEYSSSFNLGRS